VRRESSTVVVVTGEVGEDLLTGLARSANVSVARAPAAGADTDSGSGPPPAGWQAGAAALREAARRQSTYVIVPEDPLGEVAASWRAMWDGPGGATAAARFEEQAADALAAWRGQRFELPDYYLVVAPAQTDGTGPDLYLGPLRAARPRRVAVAQLASGEAESRARLLGTLASLEYGPWWPPLDELIGAARRFYAGGLAETQAGREPGSGPA
jgi:hypothetical protein